MAKKSKQSAKAFTLKLTKLELEHLRNLFSIVLPPDAARTVSSSLADATNSSMIERLLWQKIVAVLIEAGIPFADDAPDYMMVIVSQPEIAVVPVEPEDDQEKSAEEKNEK